MAYCSAELEPLVEFNTQLNVVIPLAKGTYFQASDDSLAIDFI